MSFVGSDCPLVLQWIRVPINFLVEFMLFLLKLKCLRQYRVLLCDLSLLSLVKYILYSSTLDISFERKWVLNILCLVFIFYVYFVIHSFVNFFFLFRPTNIFFGACLSAVTVIASILLVASSCKLAHLLWIVFQSNISSDINFI